MSARQYLKNGSNNSHNPNQNICALEVAKRMGVNDNVRYLHTVSDIVRAARTKYSVRSRKSQLKAGSSVGNARTQLAKITAKNYEKIYGYIIVVKGHVLLLSYDGRTLVDTDPRKADRRKITHCYALMGKY